MDSANYVYYLDNKTDTNNKFKKQELLIVNIMKIFLMINIYIIHVQSKLDSSAILTDEEDKLEDNII